MCPVACDQVGKLVLGDIQVGLDLVHLQRQADCSTAQYGENFKVEPWRTLQYRRRELICKCKTQSNLLNGA